MRKSAAIVAVGCALLCGSALADAPPAAPNCQLKRFATLPISITASGRITVPIKVEGQPLNLLVDTGGITLLTEAAATRLKLEKQPAAMRDWLFGFGGGMSRYGAQANLEIAGIPITGKAFNLMSSPIEPNVDGLLGADILQAFDVDIDYANAKLSLFSPEHCPGRVVYWTHDPYAVVPVDVSGRDHKIRLDVDLDGHSMSSYLDTGASTSVLIYEEAEAHFDVDKAMLERDRRFPFKGLTFEGGVVVANPDIRLFRRNEALVLGSGNAPDMLIGADILRQLHVYIAYKEEKIYATGMPASAVAYSHLVQGMNAAGKDNITLAISQYNQALDAGGLVPDQRRRAMLERATMLYRSGDCSKALTDLDRVIAESPNDEQAYMDRAHAKACRGDKTAIADMDFLISRDPGWVNYYVRGRINWTLGDFGTAAADFGKSYELEPGNPYTFMWLAFSTGRTQPLDQAAFAEKAAKGRKNWPHDWPMPIIDVYLQKKGAEAELAKIIASKDTATRRRCEADFYLGEWLLIGGQLGAAKALLQKAADECEIDSMEIDTAKVELARSK